ncbi:hypothetical protein C1X89_29870 [Pseudomonas sp. GP01-A8]|nr:hypothetical protein C1X90_32670 [Pseudomonas sp. GP01-A9]PMU21326.1 hypothetical protein C1X88_29930 [Pseudomonas sp. GP01-A13]PMU33076.1 hypothetical protein C1X89_29870 [Pseudomonas sp. GP01-A8]PMU45727.1 hypothetical protein C1X87_28410 [Pseudomonas sp. GP01-A14]PMU57513.1 hypothetical protein C1X85_02875 [Pseudomonas sp. GP01-A6]PMU59346.1 hypothetical protein C1X86_29105 [Pseudomonas sp. GP01-A3]PMU67213.1 hypothetical protein C1X84_30495 [Pseudomonas sp. GP01-A1]PMU71347.1 hypothet
MLPLGCVAAPKKESAAHSSGSKLPRHTSNLTQRKRVPLSCGKLAAEILPGGQHDYPTSLLAD